jgi:hypothetical protein
MKTNQDKGKQDKSKFVWKPGDIVITKKPKKKDTKKEKKPTAK